jgi:hypothetical protein
MSKTQPNNDRPEPRISNYPEVIHAAVRHSWMKPSGERVYVEADNPRLDDHPPTFLRMKVPRKALNFKLIEDMEEMGLKVGDVWQLDGDYTNEMIRLRFEPEEA